MFLQWLRFIEKYKVKVGESSYSDRHALNFLLEARPLTPEVNLAAFFQSLQTVPDLKRLGNSLERNLFQRWMTTVDSKPKDVARLLNIGQSVPKLSKSDLRYKILEAYTLQFAEKSGKETLEKVKELLVANDLNAALTAAVKLR
ncbi:hypothetical protein PHYSODRAFT_298878 [Phytophthora sojae]|uniref:RXLR phytopathogen effector protein WY-domain domain-containing protein n=1 Tax=Phytophthora sojae (strain P6497) TaxID=1094619 RepID=G4Z630_PHYSP|nr:hypothetical protein PHYSODRAFT_298878 [Phytophthora sojae]EGZ20951.1 hypothetical protein PHYSODRAFT_298878 [Phytophthora sojae]|eukprot:XP_009523668.1 hypothetical protein PHYSODRAFT_298878 [Phytophthora sojae]